MQAGKQASLATRGWTVVACSIAFFGMPMLLEKVFRPIWVLADPSSSNVHLFMPAMLVGVGIGLLLVLIDAVGTSGRMQ